MKYSLIDATDKHMTRKRFSLPRLSAHNPSSASVKWKDFNGIQKVSGTCLRSLFYRNTGVPGGTSPDAYSEWIFATGKGVEEILVEQWKEMGIWVGNNIKFYDKEKNISGELDVVLSEPDGTLYGAEIKSFSGYSATKEVIGNTKFPGKPKISQMLQTLIYVDLCKRLGILQYFKMIYYARDSGERTEYDIGLVQDGEYLRPTINDEIDYRFTMQDIYDRYNELDFYMENKTLPPRDYSISWSAEQVEEAHQAGEITEAKYLKYKKSPSKNPIGNWQCNYCAYKEVCWKGKEDG